MLPERQARELEVSAKSQRDMERSAAELGLATLSVEGDALIFSAVWL